MGFLNKLVMTVKRPSKRAKLLCKHLYQIFKPSVVVGLNGERTEMVSYLNATNSHELSHLIFVDARDIKIGILPSGPTYVFNITEYNSRYIDVGKTYYKEDPYITFTGGDDFEELFISLSSQPKTSKRSLHFHFEENFVYVRHYAVLTKEENENIKVGLNEIGPRITLMFIKKTGGLFS